jgi:inner membrane protein
VATAFTHAFVALAAGKICFARPMPWKFWVLAMGCSALPDLDVGLHSYGVEYEDLWGHRGMMHSLLFAAALAFAVVSWFFRREAPFGRRQWWGLFIFFFVVTASHGVIDAFTDGGLGIAFFSPFDASRYFAPWNPIPVSNFGLSSMFDHYGAHVMLTEVKLVWLPIGAMAAVAMALRRMVKTRPAVVALSSPAAPSPATSPRPAPEPAQSEIR